jgi:hypothetical protein
LRILLRSRLDPTTPLGNWSRLTWQGLRDELLTDLRRSGFTSTAAADRRRTAMICDAVLSMTAELTLGHADGRYVDLEEAIDVLVAFSKGYLTLWSPTTTRRAS